MRNPNLELPEQQKTVAPTVTQPKVQQNKSTVKPNLPELPKQGSTRKAQYATKVETIPYNANTNPYAAQVYQLGMQIGKYGANDKLANQFRSAYLNYQNTQTNPYSQYYNPYSKATNYKAIEGLRSYGYDPDQMTDDQIRMLTVGKRTTATGYDAAAPLSSGKSTPEQDLAYWAQEYLQAQDTTIKAEKELDDLGKDIEYYVSKGYSDKQIYDAVSSKYSTLNSMMSKKAEGNAVLLNRAVNFNGDDTIYGMIWSARNGGSVGDYGLDAAAYYSKIGNTYKPDEAYTRRHDATNKDTYNPYADGTTLNLGDKYRVINFSREWLQEHRLELDEDDILKIDDAITNSEKAEAEIAQLNEYIAKQLEGKTPQQQVEIYKKLADRLSDDKNDWLNEQGYATLSKMESKRTSGNPLSLGYGVDFNLKDTINDLRARGEAINGEIKTEEAQAEADKRMANARKKFKNDDEGFLKEVDSIIADLQTNEQFNGADIDTIISGIQNDVHGARLKIDKTAQTKARVEEIRASGDTLGERMASGNYSEAQLKEKTKQWLRGVDVGEDWEALMGGTLMSLLHATDNVDYGKDYLPDVYLANTSKEAADRQVMWQKTLGPEVYGALERVKNAFDEGVISADQYVDYCYALEQKMEEAREKGSKDYELYLMERFDYNQLDSVIDAQREQQAREQAQADKLAHDTRIQMLDAADEAVKSGDASDQDIAIVSAYKNMDMNTVFSLSPSLQESYNETKESITESVTEELYWKLNEAFGTREIAAWESNTSTAARTALLRSNASQIAEIAMDSIQDDYRRAAFCDMTLDEYYELHPDRKPDMDSLIESATATYNMNWGKVWLDVDNIIANKKAGEDMTVPRATGGLEDIFDATARIGDTRDDFIMQVYNAEAGRADSQAGTMTEAKANELPVWEAAYLMGKLGTLSFAKGGVNAFSYYVTYAADDQLEAYNRAHYVNDPVRYRQDLIKTVQNGISDPELAAYYTKMLEEYDGDIFNVTINFLDQNVQNVLYSIKENAAKEQQHIDEKAAKWMADAIDTGSSIVNNVLMLAETAVLSAVGMPPLAATVTAYGLPEGAEMGQELEAAGINHHAARGIAVTQAVLTGLMEKAITYDNYIGSAVTKMKNASAVRTAMNAITRGNFNPNSIWGKLGRGVANAMVNSFSEGLQESTEALEQFILKSVAEQVWTGDAHLQENWENANVFMEGVMGAITAPFLSLAGAGLGRVSSFLGRGEANMPESERMAKGLIDGTIEWTPDNLQKFRDALEIDTANPRVLAEIEADEMSIEAQERMTAAITDGQMDQLLLNSPEAKALTDAQKASDDLKAELDQKTAALKSASDALTSAEQAFNSNPADKAAADRYNELLKEFTDAKNAYEEAKAKQPGVDDALTQARTANEEARRAAVIELYEQKLLEVQAEHAAKNEVEQSVNEARVEAEVAQDTLDEAAAIHEEEQTADSEADLSIAQSEVVLAQKRHELAEIAFQQMTNSHTTLGDIDRYMSQKVSTTEEIARLEAEVQAKQAAQQAQTEQAQTEQAQTEQTEDAPAPKPKKIPVGTKAVRTSVFKHLVKEMGGRDGLKNVMTIDADADAGAYAGKPVVISGYRAYALNADAPTVSALSGLPILPAENNMVTILGNLETGFQNAVAVVNPPSIADVKAFVDYGKANKKQVSIPLTNGEQKIFVNADYLLDTMKMMPNNTLYIGAAEDKNYPGRYKGIPNLYTDGEDGHGVVLPVRITSEERTDEYDNFMKGRTQPKNTADTKYYHGESTFAAGAKAAASQGQTSEAEAAAEAARPAKTGKPVSPVKTIEDLAKKLKVGLYRTKSRNVNAQYSTWAKSVTQSSKQAANLAMAMHEIGHHIQNVTEWKLPDGVIESIMPVDLSSPGMPFEERAEEAFAEFFSGYMMSRSSAVKLAGEDVVREFEGTLLDNGMLDDVRFAQARISGYLEGSTQDRIRAQIVDKSDAVKKEKQDRMRRWIVGMIDQAYAGKAADDLVRHQRKNNDNEEWTMEDALHYRVYHKRLADVCMTHALVDSKGNKIRESMSDMLANNGITAKNADEFMYYRLAKHALDRNALDKRVFGDSDNITDAQLAKYVSEHQEFEEANQAFTEWWQEFTQAWLVDTGIVNQETMNRWNEMYKSYTPTFRDISGNSIDAGFTKEKGTKGTSWRFKPAGTSDLDIINPWDSFIELTNSIVSRAADNEVGQVFDKMYTEYQGLGIFAEKISEVKHKAEGRSYVNKVDEQAPVDMRIETEEPTGPIGIDTTGIAGFLMPSDVPNTSTGGRLVVAREDGTVVTYDFNQGDMLLYSALTSQGPEVKNALLRGVSAINRKFSALTTGSNPLFGARNVTRDVQHAVTQGTTSQNKDSAFHAAAMLEAGYMPYWLSTAVDYLKQGDITDEFTRMGGGGWSYSDTADAKGRVQARQGILKGYSGNTTGEKVGNVARKAFATFTFEKVNEMLERTTRQTEYASGAYDRSTWQGRRKAFLASQDVTVDFGRYGMSGSYTVLKSVIPFFGPTVQGVAQAAKTVHDAFSSDVSEADHKLAWKQIGKKALNSGIRAALQTALIHIFCNDEEKKEYGEIAQDIRTGHLILPGKLFGIKEKPWVRIPIGQSVIDRAFYASFSKVFEEGSGLDDVSVNLLDAGFRILQDASPIDVFQLSDVGTWMNGVMSSTIAAIPWALATNMTYYGGNVESPSFENTYFTERYYSNTPDAFIWMSRAIDEMNRQTGSNIQLSPIELQYIAKQYTGFFGQILIPLLSPDRATGNLTLGNALYNLKNGVSSSWTIDNLTNNDISDAYYDYSDQIGWLTRWDPKSDHVPGLCDPNLDPEDMVRDAKSMQKRYNSINKQVMELTQEINAINNDTDLTPSERAMAVREPERQRLDLMYEWNTECNDFFNEYGATNLFERFYRWMLRK